MLKRLNLRGSLKTKLTVLFLALGIIPMALVGLISYNMAQNSIRNEVQAALAMYGALANEELTTYYNEREGDARVLATTREVYQSLNILEELDGDTADPAWQERLDMLRDTGPIVLEEYGYDVMMVTDTNGEIVYSTDETMIGLDISDRDYMQGSLGGATTWGDLYYSDVVNANVMAVSTPAFSRGTEGELVGTLSLVKDQVIIDQIVHAGLQELGDTADAYLVNSEGLLHTNTRIGEYQEGAALQANINTRAVELLAGPVQDGNLEFQAQEEYREYRGEPVLGDVSVALLGAQPIGLVVEIDQAEAFAGVMALRNIILPLVAVAGVLVGVVGIFVSNSIVRPVQKISELTHDLAEGDFTVRAQVRSGDEIGQMGQDLNGTIEALGETLARVQEAASQVASASQQLNASSEETTSAASEVAKAVEDMASGASNQAQDTEAASGMVEGLGEIMAEDQGYVQNLNEDATRVDALKEEGSESVKLLAEKTEENNRAVQEIQTAISETSQSAEKISRASDMIKGIADQTNLLSLNASIEAARAGEHGRGFAVVADEIRKLAAQSNEYSEEISAVIQELTRKTQAAVSTMDEVAGIVQVQNEAVQDTREKFGGIATAIQEVKTVVERLNDSGQSMEEKKSALVEKLQNLAAVAEENSASAQEISASVEEQTSAMDEVAKSSETLAVLAQELQDSVSRFKLYQG